MEQTGVQVIRSSGHSEYMQKPHYPEKDGDNENEQELRDAYLFLMTFVPSRRWIQRQ